jgi:hypothetical protein
VAATEITPCPPGQAVREDVSRGDLGQNIGQTDSGFKQSLIYSGILALALAAVGLAMVGWRRRQW